MAKDRESTSAERAAAVVARRRANWADTPEVERGTRSLDRRGKRKSLARHAKLAAQAAAEKRRAEHRTGMAKVAEAHRAAMATPEAKARRDHRAAQRAAHIAAAQARFQRREVRPGRANKGDRVIPHGGN